MNDAISAFIDNEPFDPQALRVALETPEGREALLDLIALRGLVQPHEVVAVPAPPRSPAALRWALAAAAAVLLVLSGYGVGRSITDTQVEATAQVTAPVPTAIATFDEWNDSLPSGGN